MGKLHTLRRAIQRNPRAFMMTGPVFETVGQDIRFTGTQLYCFGAEFHEGQWRPANSPRQYYRFVRSTLVKLGYDIPL